MNVFLLPLLLAGCGQHRMTAHKPVEKLLATTRCRSLQAEVIRGGQYVLVNTLPTALQRYPLQQIKTLTQPAVTLSVADAMRYALQGSGYRLCTAYGDSVAILLKQPLPDVQRSIGPISVQNALQLYAGPAWEPVVDEVNRVLCYQLRSGYHYQAVHERRH